MVEKADPNGSRRRSRGCWPAFASSGRRVAAQHVGGAAEVEVIKDVEEFSLETGGPPVQ
jgi:hypothetical protein